MDILGPATFSDILLAWALHEFNGRHQRWLPPDVRGLPPDEARQEALSVLVQGRFSVILPMLAANIRECLSVRFYPADIPQLFAMGAVPLPTYSQRSWVSRLDQTALLNTCAGWPRARSPCVALS